MTVDKPVCKSFVYKNRYFVYDTYSNSLLEIQKGHYTEMSELVRVGINEYLRKNKHSQEYDDIIHIIKKGMLKSCIIENITNKANEYLENLLKRSMNELTLQVTKRCNFNCRYCLFATENGIDRRHENIDMDWSIARESIDFLYRNSIDAECVTISFYGGEPLLNIALIDKIVAYSEAKFVTKNVKYRATINGALLTDDVIEFLINNKFYIAISLDGDRDVQDKHRVFMKNGAGTFDTVYNNILKIRQMDEEYFANNVVFMPVIFPDEDRTDMYNFFHENQIFRNQIVPLDVDLTGVDYILRGNYDRKEGNNYFVKKHGEEMEERFHDKKAISKDWHHNGPCIPGINRLFVSTDGLFYSCEKVPDSFELSIGSLSRGFDVEKIKSMMNIGLITEHECKSCWAMRYCNICYLQCVDIETCKIDPKMKPCQFQREGLLSFFKKKIDSIYE